MPLYVLQYPSDFNPHLKTIDHLGNLCYPQQHNDGFSDHVFKTVKRILLVPRNDERETHERGGGGDDGQDEEDETDSEELAPMDAAMLIWTHGVESGRQRIMARAHRRLERQKHREQIIQLARQKAAQRAREMKKFDQLKRMIKCIVRFIFEYERDGIPFRLEPFQMEIFRGMVLGCAERQLGHDLYKYKHLLLDMVGLASPAVARFDPEINNPRLLAEVDRLFNFYNKCYMVATVPRRCGKTTMVSIVLGAMLSFLSIDIMVQAQNLEMAKNIQKTVEDFMNLYKSKTWFPEEYKYIEVTGTCKCLTYKFKDNIKEGKTTAHYLASSGNVSIITTYMIINQWWWSLLSNACPASEWLD